MPVEFEWDERKREANLAKHNVDFVDAAEALSGPSLVRIDARRDYGEVRFIAIGRVGGVTLSIVCTFRAEHCRIISARRANPRERAAYRSL
ncbi:MAG: BrnT family toxin [Gemmatimonadales bacterium]